MKLSEQVEMIENELMNDENDGIYEIPENKLGTMLDKLSKLNKRAERLGVTGFTVTPTGNVRDVELKRQVANTYEGTGVFVRLIEIKVEGEAPQIAGWEFAATLQHNEVGNILRTVPGAPALPTEYRTIEPRCEHCETVRERKDTYILHHVENDEWKQVGRTCLRDFTGVNSPHKIANLAAQFSEYIDELRASEEYDDDFFGGGYSQGQVRFSIEKYLTWVVVMVREHGWVSRSNAREWMKPASADLASTAMSFNKDEREQYEIAEPQECDAEKAKAALAWGREQLTAKSTSPSMSDYEWNLYVAISNDVIEYREFGIVASLIAWYNRETEERVAVAKDERSNEFIGEIKERRQFDNLTVISEQSFEGYYGMTYLYKFNDEAGNEIVWFASRPQWFGVDYSEEIIGLVVSGKATIKKHEVYNGRNQTVITRAKLEIVQ